MLDLWLRCAASRFGSVPSAPGHFDSIVLPAGLRKGAARRASGFAYKAIRELRLDGELHKLCTPS